MRNHPRPRRALLCTLIAAIGMPSAPFAAQLSLVQYPAGSASREPAPNVILSLDDSGSMGNSSSAGSGMRALKLALHEIFNATTQVIPDNAIRLGWNTFNKCRDVGNNTVGCNAVRPLDATHRSRFLNWVGSPTAGGSTDTVLNGSGNTPTHAAYTAAGDYIRNASATDRNGPWAGTPGTTLEPVLSCRRNYVIMMTDGEWNITPAARPAGATAPTATSATMPDNVGRFDTNNAEMLLYRNTNATNYNKLSDLSFYYWATDLNTGLGNNVKKLETQSTPVTYTSGQTTVTLSPYWNPRNNPATWQHITTHTIGFRDAAVWSGRPTWSSTNDTYGGDFGNLVTGAVRWPDPGGSTGAKRMELWHMALAGRGRFIPATDDKTLVQAFQEIFGAIAADTSSPVTGFANSATSIALTATNQYTSGYAASGWTGFVRADKVSQDPGTGVLTTTPNDDWGTKAATPPNITTADKLNTLATTQNGIANRLVLSWRDLAAGGGGTSFEWATDQRFLSTEQKALLADGAAAADAATVAEQRLNYIRGDRRLEGSTFRTRSSIQGDIVNSSLWYVAAPVGNYGFDRYLAFATAQKTRLPMLYVGGNDGMLHGFSGVDGTEKIAYVPKGVIQNLPLLTRTDYTHRYYVDGSPFSGDVNIGTSADPDWRTMLVGTLGAGGKGYFVLDVTKPGDTASADASNFAKANAATLVVMDKTAHPSVAPTAGSAEADIGHIMAAPVLDDNNAQKATQIVRMNNGRWAVVMGNGYNSTSERPVLLIQYLDGDKSLQRIVAASSGANASDNGLSAPRLLDIDGNGSPDVAYAGDLRGNLWKFDLSSTSASGWNVAFSGQPLYSATYVAGNSSTAQPITAPPLVRANERGAGGLMVAFGTGRNLTEGDRTSTAVQSIYSVLDNTRYKRSGTTVAIDTVAATPAPVANGVADLVQQTVSNTVIPGSGSSAARSFWTVSQNAVNYTGTGAKKGWYLNLPASGERVLDQMRFFDSSNIIELISEVPASGGSTAEESCTRTSTPVQKYRTLLNIMDGKRPSIQVLDTNGDGLYDPAADQNASRITASPAENKLSTKAHEIRLGSDGTKDLLRRLPEIPLRSNWRQLQ